MNDATGDLAFLPLGGTGEIGMNLNLYRCGGAWLAVDCGIGFGGAELPEVEIMMPDPGFIADRRDRLKALVITHAHEDHIGAVAHLWRQLRCPVYATPFAMAVLRRKLSEAMLLAEVPLHVIAPGGRFSIPPFELQFIQAAHSIPESQMLAIRTPHGTILHTGDWKLDPQPLLGPPTDEAALQALGDEGVLAMVCDSTNALVEGTSGSEADVRRSMLPLIRDMTGRIAVTCFATNLARVETIAKAGQAAGRHVAIVGRSLRNMTAAARDCGYLKDVPEFLDEEDANSVPDENLLLICTGSQGEPRSALARIASDSHPHIALGEGDTVIFSSRVIPGNERVIGKVQDNLTRRGVRVMTDADHMVHVSGHPARDELRHLYRLVRPKAVIPVHGEWRHLSEHADLAREMQVTPHLVEDGDLIRLAPGHIEITDSAPTGRLVLDGNRLLQLGGAVLSARKRILFNGVVVASLAVDAAGKIVGQLRITAPGLYESDAPEIALVTREIVDAVADLPAPVRRDDDALAEMARILLRRALGKRLQKRPMVDVHLLRI